MIERCAPSTPRAGARQWALRFPMATGELPAAIGDRALLRPVSLPCRHLARAAACGVVIQT